MKRLHICCFCGKVFYGWGNNPYPANKDEDARCCDDCNTTVVIPVRLGLIRLGEELFGEENESYN